MNIYSSKLRGWWFIYIAASSQLCAQVASLFGHSTTNNMPVLRPSSGGYSIVSRDANSRVWERTVVGLVLLIGVVRNVNRGWKNYYECIKTQPRELYLDLTDEYLETGVSSLAFQRYSWNALIGMSENKHSFVLYTPFSEIKIFKADLVGEINESDLRRFFSEKLSTRNQ